MWVVPDSQSDRVHEFGVVFGCQVQGVSNDSVDRYVLSWEIARANGKPYCHHVSVAVGPHACSASSACRRTLKWWTVGRPSGSVTTTASSCATASCRGPTFGSVQ